MPAEEPSPKNKQRDIVTRFHEEYGVALEAAEVQQNHTDTQGWQQLYAGVVKHYREQRRKMADQLKQLAEELEKHGLNEEQEKSIRVSLTHADAAHGTNGCRQRFDRRPLVRFRRVPL